MVDHYTRVNDSETDDVWESTPKKGKKNDMQTLFSMKF